MGMKVDIRVPVGLPVVETAEFIAGCEAAGFSGVGIHDHQHSGRDVFLTLAMAAERTSRITLYPATSPANSTIRGPAAVMFTGVGASLTFLKRVSTPLKVTLSPRSSRRIVKIASRMVASDALGLPMLPTERKPGPTVKRIRPGAISSRVWANDARTIGWRVTGLEVAGYRVRLEVRSAAKAKVRYTSRPLC